MILRHPDHVVGQRAVGDHHALGLAGGAGGVDDVGEMIGSGLAGGRGRRPAGDLGGVAVEEDDVPFMDGQDVFQPPR